MSNETTKPVNAGFAKILPVMFAFFVMGFVDLVGTATNYVKAEFGLADGTANLFTTMVFFWFLIFSVPTGILMNKIGRRKTVLWSILVTLVAMALPIIAYLLCPMKSTVQLVLIVISFAFLGIGNTLMQVSLNPLLTVFVKGDKLASTLTLGQFVKAFASLFAPWIAMWGANSISAFTYTNADGKQVGMWWILFVIYFIVGILGYVLLAFDKIEEPAPDAGTTTIGRCFKLLFSDRIVLLCFLGIVAHVGVDVAINAQAPRILTEHTGDTFTAIASSATMVYFVARMIGCFTGGIVLQKISNKLGVRICGVIMTLSAICFAIFTLVPTNPPVWLFWVAVALERVLAVPLPRAHVPSGPSERDLRPDAHGPDRRRDLPAHHGCRGRRRGSVRRHPRDGHRLPLRTRRRLRLQGARKRQETRGSLIGSRRFGAD